jgi:cell filamentation protein
VAGYELNWPEVSKEKWIEANEKGYLGDVSFLELIFNMAIS